jgi:peptidoglycan-associated lipoprotein
MKKALILCLVLSLALAFSLSCRKKVQELPPPPPSVKEQPAAEKVDEGAKVVKPTLSEEEIFASKTLDQLNQDMPLSIIYFDFNEYFIREEAKPVLESNTAWLKKFRTVKALIEGHCDERGTEDYNLALGERRAQSAREYLISLGVSPERLKTISYGKSQPLDPGHDEFAWAKNRRAQFLIIDK